ncbi:MAG TPA: FliI/YscN family ATPase [Terriglobales bacterium]|jgi:flagellum-specific ATP synthase
MTGTGSLTKYFTRLRSISGHRWQGSVTQVLGSMIESSGPFCASGDACEILDPTGVAYAGQILGFRGNTVLSMTFDPPRNVRFGDRVVTWGARPQVRVGKSLIGRVIDALGEPLDGGPAYDAEATRELETGAPQPFERELISDTLACGVRAIDGMLTCGRGQRMGIFGGSGVGKSTLVGIMARNTSADVTVLALIGERGREVREFLEHSLGEAGRRRSVVVVSTSDQTPLLRLRGALAATTIAEHFCHQGKNVLLVVDSLTRLAMAQREISLMAGEPPTSKGYTPSVFSLMARLIERAGKFSTGSITAFYTVLMEGDDQQDPIVDTARALLDGHIMLDRRLAIQNHYPPISVLDSVSRLMPSVCAPAHLEKAGELRQLLAAYSAAEDLVRIGAYQKGADSTLDIALEVLPELRNFLRQEPGESPQFDQTRAQLLDLGCKK